MLKIKDLKTLRKLTKNNKEGELAIVEETRVLYKWDGANWIVYKPEGGLKTNLYELNQGAMTAAPAMEIGAIETAKQKIVNYISKQNSNYFMLLSNDRNYYTVFLTGYDTGTDFNYPKIENEAIECLQNRGILKDIDEVEGGIEFWVTEGDNSYVYYLFDYQGGVIKCQ